MIVLVAGINDEPPDLGFLIFTAIAWLANALRRGSVLRGPAIASPAATARLESVDAIFLGINRPTSSSSSARCRSLTELSENAAGVTWPHDRASRTAAGGAGRGRAPPRQDEIDASKDANGIATKVPSGSPAAIGCRSRRDFFSQRPRRDLPTAMRVGGREAVRWFGMILFGPRRASSDPVSDEPDGPAARRRSRSGSPTQIADIYFRGAGFVMTLYVAGDPVGQPRPRASCRRRRSTADGC